MAVEIEIPVPWGQISGKRHGNSNGEPVLCVHGLQDNAGTFDRLIPLLPKNYLYLAIDLPGHGKSSHFKSGIPLVFLQFVFTIKLIIDHYKWNKVTVLAHSFGCHIMTIFAAIYPEYCQKIVLFDGILPNSVPSDRLFSFMRRQFDEFQELDKKLNTNTPPSYTYEEAIDRFISNRFGQCLSRESADILIKRSLIKSGDGFCFSTDQRLKKSFKFPFSLEQLLLVVKTIQCPCLMLIASDTYNTLFTRKGTIYLKKIDALTDLPNFKFRIVEGNHYFHMEKSQLISENIIPFLLFNKCSL